MTLSVIIVVFCCVSVIFGAISGNSFQVGQAALSGVNEAIKFSFSVGGLICLWCGVMEVLRSCGIAEALGKLLRPLLRSLFPIASRDSDTMSCLTMNLSANLLGLGNAATPMGIRAAEGMAPLDATGRASDELCMLVCINTASIQLLPTTVASVRAAAGAAAPFDILPAVWLASLCSVLTAITAGRLFSALFRRWRL